MKQVFLFGFVLVEFISITASAATGIECARGSTIIQVVSSTGSFDPNHPDSDAGYSVQILNGSQTFTLIAKGACFFAAGVDLRAFTCFDEFGSQAQNMISTNLFGANGPGYNLEMWSGPAHQPNGDPQGGVLTNDVATSLGLGPLDLDGETHFQIPYSQTIVPIIDGFSGYCAIK